MKVQNTKREENSKNPDNLFVQEFFGSFDITIRNSIQSILDLYQYKWSVRLMLLSFYFLEEKANEISINQVRDFAYGTSEIPGLVHKGRFYQNNGHVYNFSHLILEAGITKTLNEVNFNHSKFLERGGIYKW